MPRRTDIAAPQIDEKVEQAARAVRTFAGLCPELSIFATILVGRDPSNRKEAITVVPGSQTATDGRTISIRPDARLAGAVSDSEWSDIKASLFHEVAHIAFDSFAKIDERDRITAIRNVTESMEDSIRRDAILRRMDHADANYRSLAEAWHASLPMMVNALEDARVEALLFVAKPGTHKHLEPQRMEIFDAPREVIVERIGTPWGERSPDEQIIIGCYMLGAGYHVEGRLAEQPAKDLRTLEPMILSAVNSGSVHGVYTNALAILTAAQELGYLRNGDERDADIGETAHEDPKPGSPMQRAEEQGCPHPKSKIVPCDGAKCRGNCTQCGTHLIAQASKTSEATPEPGDDTDSEPGEPGEDESSEGADGDGPSSDTGEGTSDDGESEADGRSGAAEGDADSDAESGTSGREDAVTDAESDGANGGGAAFNDDEDAEVEDGVDRIEDAEEIEPTERTAPEFDAESAEAAVHAAGGHTHDDDTDVTAKDDSLDPEALKAALDLIDAGYAEGEQPATGVGSIKRDDTLLKTTYVAPRGRANSPAVESAIAHVMPELRNALALNGISAFSGGMRSGRVDVRSLHRTAVGDARVFGRFTEPETRNYQFVLALDCSGSMHEYDPDSGTMGTMKNAALAAMEMLNRLSVPFIAFGYSGDRDRYSDGGYTLNITDVCGEDRPWDDTARERLFNLKPYAANLDGSTMQYARIRGRKACKQPNTELIVLYFNDGGMPAENPTAEKQLIRWEVASQRRNRVHYIGVGLDSSSVERAGLELVACNNPKEGAINITTKISELLGVGH